MHLLQALTLASFSGLTVVRAAPTPRAAAAAFSWAQTKYMFVFGDSYTTTSWEPSNGVASTDPGQTTSGGQNWVMDMAYNYNQSEILLRNFAYSGATISRYLVAPADPSIVCMDEQVRQFLDGFSPPPAQVPWTSSDALFLSWIGINDIGLSYGWTNVSHDQFNTQELQTWYNLQVLLYNSGAVPPTWRTPMFVSDGQATQDKVEPIVKNFDSQLKTYSDMLKSNYPDVHIIYVEALSEFGQFQDNYAEEGFKDASTYCDAYGNYESDSPYGKDPSCPYSLNEYFWINNYHPTWPVHNLIAQSVVKQMPA